MCPGTCYGRKACVFVLTRQFLRFIGVFDTLSKLVGVTVRDMIYLIALVTRGS